MPKTKEYECWKKIRARCSNKNSPDYPRYGGRGIMVCQRWNSYHNFFEDMGLAPSPKHSIERIKNDGNYEPGNCRWATNKEQANNRDSNVLIKYQGRVQNVKQWCEEIGITYETVRIRMKRLKWTPERAFTTPIAKCVRKPKGSFQIA